MKLIKLFPICPVAKVLDYLEKIYPLDTGVTEIIKKSGISSSTFFEEVLPHIMDLKLIESRKIGKRKLYKLKNKLRIVNKR